MLIWSEGYSLEVAPEDRDHNLWAFIERCRKYGLKLHKKKLRQPKVLYVGHRARKVNEALHISRKAPSMNKDSGMSLSASWYTIALTMRTFSVHS